jgi:hypothetical protein
MTETITISDYNAGTYVCTTVTEPKITSVTYTIADDVTLTYYNHADI